MARCAPRVTCMVSVPGSQPLLCMGPSRLALCSRMISSRDLQHTAGKTSRVWWVDGHEGRWLHACVCHVVVEYNSGRREGFTAAPQHAEHPHRGRGRAEQPRRAAEALQALTGGCGCLGGGGLAPQGTTSARRRQQAGQWSGDG